MGAVCGLRLGEALSFRNEDLDLIAGTVQVHRTLWKNKVYPPKTPSSRRTLKLPRIGLEALTRHRKATGNTSEGWCFPTKNEAQLHRKAIGCGDGSRRYGRLNYQNL